MAYDYGSSPEPVNMVIRAVEMARAEVPAEKLVLGISAVNENPQSILTKVGIAKRYNLGEIALGRLGLVSDEMWNALRTTGGGGYGDYCRGLYWTWGDVWDTQWDMFMASTGAVFSLVTLRKFHE